MSTGQKLNREANSNSFKGRNRHQHEVKGANTRALRGKTWQKQATRSARCTSMRNSSFVQHRNGRTGKRETRSLPPSPAGVLLCVFDPHFRQQLELGQRSQVTEGLVATPSRRNRLLHAPSPLKWTATQPGHRPRPDYQGSGEALCATYYTRNSSLRRPAP